MKLLAPLLFLAIPFFSFARSVDGPGVGGGGGAVVCLNPDQSIKSVEIVDLVESAFYDKTKISPSLNALSWQKQVEIVVNRMAFVDPQFYALLVDRVAFVKKQMAGAFEGTKDTEVVFPPPQDLSSGRVPPIKLGCQILGAAVFNDNFQNEQRLNISDLLWKNLSETHKAALFLHEAIYLTHRDIYRNLDLTDYPNSSATRALVGFAFSEEFEKGSKTQAERERFAESEFYRSEDLGRKDRDVFTRKVESFFQPLLPFAIKGLDRPLLLGSPNCKGQEFIVRVDYKAEAYNCLLKVKAHLWPSKREVRELPVIDQRESVRAYSFLPHKNEKVYEDLVLVCPAKGLNRYNPGFKMYCGSEMIAEVKSTYRNTTTGFSLKKKSDFEKSFSVPFKWE